MATKKHVVPCYDHQRRTCIQVERSDTHVKYIPLDINGGLQVMTMAKSEFDRRYSHMLDYPVAKACQLFLGYSQTIGATEEALNYLAQVIDVSSRETDTATKKKIELDERTSAKKEAARPAAKKEAATKPAKPAATKPAATKPAAKKQGSAAKMFQELIMDGGLTDSEIFAKVKEEFGLDEKSAGTSSGIVTT